MDIFTFSNGEFANYDTLYFTISGLTFSSSVRLGYYVGSTFIEIDEGYYPNDTKTVDLSSLGINLSTVTKIAFDGGSDSKFVVVKDSDMYIATAAVTGIKSVRTSVSTINEKKEYNLAGQRIAADTKSIVINNCIKFMTK